MREFTLEDFKDTDYTYDFLKKLKELDPDLTKVYEPDLESPNDIMWPVIISKRLTSRDVNRAWDEFIVGGLEYRCEDACACALPNEDLMDNDNYSLIRL